MSNAAPRNIVLLSDGTGNSAKAVFKTNVWRLFQLLDLRDPGRQIAFYDDGVGTSSFKLFAALGGIFGFGLKRNVIALYSFCCRNYRPGDRIYCFGFSRGAFTIRIVAAMIAGQGLVDYNNNEADLARFAGDAYRRYRQRYNSGILKYLGKIGLDLRGIRDWGIRELRSWRGLLPEPPPIEVESVHFVGIWDTVDAYGGPIEEMIRAIDYWVWPLSMPDRFMSAKIHRACHALALEEERDAFRPVIWDERYVRARAVVDGRPDKTDWLFDIDHDPRSAAAKLAEPAPRLRTDLPPRDRERISQVWFTGVHSDIGGGYPQDGLSYVTLDWMLDRAKAYGLIYLDERRRVRSDPEIDANDKLNNSREGLAAYYRYKPRNLLEIYAAPPYKLSFRADVKRVWRLIRKQPDPQVEILADLHPSMSQTVLPPPKPTIHRTVFERIATGTDRYVPVVVPKTYRVTDATDTPVDTLHPADPGAARSKVQDDVWNWVWLRRVVYFSTMFALLFVAAIPLFVIYAPRFGHDTFGPYVNPIVNAAASFLPKLLDPWFVAFRDGPGFVLIGVIVLAVLSLWGTRLQQSLRDVARIAWHEPHTFPALSGWHSAVYRLRRLGIYKAFFYVLTHWIFPTAIMWWLFWWLAFGTANTLGLFCKGTGEGIEVGDTPIEARKSVRYKNGFETSQLCYATGLSVAQDETYVITLDVATPWSDAEIPASPTGFGYGTLAQVPGIPFKRLIWSNWFAPIVRVGGTGLEEHLPEFKQDPANASRWTAEFIARSNGEVFVYVNDTSIFLPWFWHAFYDNNHGSATVSLRRKATEQ
ncbi:MAG: DUF2235 domain-containing protein [Bradyrhizobium sp.]|nr:DUF2235 domain-containing protein [Bradyrhizobium sp.]